MITFILRCDNLLQSEEFDAAIMSGDGHMQRRVFRSIVLKARRSLRFDFDSIGWEWCNGDSFVILGKNDKIKEQWPLDIQSYAPGECPRCHGSNRCIACSGRGFVYTSRNEVDRCYECHGTGVCQVCYVPQRSAFSEVEMHSPDGYMSSRGDYVRMRQCENLRRNIIELQEKIRCTEMDMRMMQLKDMDHTNSSSYLSYNQLLHQYHINLINLQSRLEQLESMQ